jgi:dTDP-4-amino-4,6-dideoxygalactose transaminase
MTLVHYPLPIHLQPAYRGRLGDLGSFPQSELAAREVLSLPLYPELTDQQVISVTSAIAEYCKTMKFNRSQSTAVTEYVA